MLTDWSLGNLYVIWKHTFEEHLSRLALTTHPHNEALRCVHYSDVIMGAIASQISNLMIVYSTVYSDVDQRKHQSSASLAFVWGSHRGPVNSRRKWPVTQKMFPFDDVAMYRSTLSLSQGWLLHHDDVTTWERFLYYSSNGYRTKTDVRMFPLMSAWTNCWTSIWVTSDAWHHDAHVTSL